MRFLRLDFPADDSLHLMFLEPSAKRIGVISFIRHQRSDAGGSALGPSCVKMRCLLRPSQVKGKLRENPAQVNLPSALPCSTATAHKLAGLATRLSDLGETQSKQLVNWGNVKWSPNLGPVD